MENNILFIELLCELKEIIYIKHPCLAPTQRHSTKGYYCYYYHCYGKRRRQRRRRRRRRKRKIEKVEKVMEGPNIHDTQNIHEAYGTLIYEVLY